MKKQIATIAVAAGIGLVATQAQALDPLGSPVPSHGKGGWSIGGEYSQSEAQVKRLLPTWNSANNDEVRHDLSDITRYGVILTYGISDNIEAFARVGKAEADSEQYSAGNGKKQFSMSGNDETYYGAGLKIFLCTIDAFRIGLTGQWSTTDYTSHGFNPNWDGGENGTVRDSVDEIQVALGAETDVTETITVFGGIVGQQINGDNVFIPDDEIGTNSSNRSAIEEDSVLGFYVGGNINITDNISLSGEYQGVGDDNLLGGKIRWKM